MNSKIKEYFENKENRIKCGITGGTIALAVVIFTVMVFMEKNETPNNPTETVSQTESDTQTEEAAGYCSIQKCQWKIWHIRQNGMSPVRHFCWKMSVMRGADVMM